MIKFHVSFANSVKYTKILCSFCKLNSVKYNKILYTYTELPFSKILKAPGEGGKEGSLKIKQA